MSVMVFVVDDEPDVEALFRQHFRRDLRAGRFEMDFAGSATAALARVGGPLPASLSQERGADRARIDRNRTRHALLDEDVGQGESVHVGVALNLPLLRFEVSPVAPSRRAHIKKPPFATPFDV